MAGDKKDNVLLNNLAIITSPENIQKYILGTKKNGTPRAVYDIIKDYSQPAKKKGKKKKNKGYKDSGDITGYSLYVTTKKKGKKKKKKDKYWHI